MFVCLGPIGHLSIWPERRWRINRGVYSIFRAHVPFSEKNHMHQNSLPSKNFVRLVKCGARQGAAVGPLPFAATPISPPPVNFALPAPRFGRRVIMFVCKSNNSLRKFNERNGSARHLRIWCRGSAGVAANQHKVRGFTSNLQTHFRSGGTIKWCCKLVVEPAHVPPTGASK